MTLQLGLSYIATAQNPGYLGKKVVLSTEASGMPITGFFISNEKIYDFNFKFAFKVESALKENLSTGIRIERSEDIIGLRKWSTSLLTPFEIMQFSSGISRPSESRSAAHYSVFNYSVFLRCYRRNFGSIAPLGAYINLELQHSQIEVWDDGRYYNDSDQTKIHSLSTQNIIVGAGLQNIFFDRLSVDFSINLGLNYVGLNAQTDYRNYIGKGGSPVFRDIESKVLSDNILNSRISVGWLVF